MHVVPFLGVAEWRRRRRDRCGKGKQEEPRCVEAREKGERKNRRGQRKKHYYRFDIQPSRL
jgi:hypothetical protein